MTNPGNIVRIRSRNKGLASVYEANMWAQGWSQGLFEGSGVTQSSTPAMNVVVGGSQTRPDVIIGSNPAGYKIVLDIIGQQTLPISAPASNSRIASIVAYTNDLAIASTDAATTGSPSSCGLIVVNGATAASPSPASDSVIRAAITSDGATGSQAVYSVVATVRVDSTTTAITNALITSNRATMSGARLSKESIPADNVDSATFRYGPVIDHFSNGLTVAAGTSTSFFTNSTNKVVMLSIGYTDRAIRLNTRIGSATAKTIGYLAGTGTCSVMLNPGESLWLTNPLTSSSGGWIESSYRAFM